MISSCFRVIYNEVIQTSKYYMRDVTAIESAWLLELAPHFYQQGTVGMNRQTTCYLPLHIFKYTFIFQCNVLNSPAPQPQPPVVHR